MKKEWIINKENISGQSLLKQLLFSRGIKTDDEIHEFLNPLTMELTSPNVFCDMEKVTQRLSKAIENQEKIVIYGDFDADGVTSTAVLMKTLEFLNANVEYYIPDRENEGHGFDTKALIKLMTNAKPKVIISVDCGISDVDAIKFINSFKTIDVIITDHHEAPDELPSAYAIINPKAPNALSDKLSSKQIEYLTYLAGCGVAFKVAQALLTNYNKLEFIYEILPFVAIGTIADVVPLLGENRCYVTKGLDLISQGKHHGIKRLLESAGYDITKGITSENIAFGAAPRINASGRLDTVTPALKILLSDNPQEIEMAIITLNDFNKARQTLCQEIFEQADKMVQKEGNRNPAIILCNEDWHIGIIGIVASKLVEKYYKPVFLMSYNKEKDQYRCSARSIEGVPLYDVISANAELFDGFGGHKLAAGLSFSGEKTPFEIAKKALNNTVKDFLSVNEVKPYLNIDLKLLPNDVTIDLIENLNALEPFGASNPSPIFELDNLKIIQKKRMGNDNSHLRLTLLSGATEFTAIWWKHGETELNTGDTLDIAFHPQINEFNGNISVQLIIDDVHSDALNYDEPVAKCAYKIYDNRNKTGILSTVNDYIKNSKYNIKVFAESKAVLDTIKPYNEIFSRVFTRQDIVQCDTLMFFDYPADSDTMNAILEKTHPQRLHFMNYEPKVFDEQDLLKTFNGMLKFACHNNDGKVDLIRCASFLGKSVRVLEMLMSLFEENGFIKIIDKNSSFYIIEFLSSCDTVRIMNSNKFEQIFELMLECEEYQKTLLNGNLEEVLV